MDVVYIAGSSRSGSTLLARILGQIDDFVVPGELRHIWRTGAPLLAPGELCGCGRTYRECPLWTAVAADVFDEALTVGNSTTLQRYPAQLEESFAQYHKVGRLTARFLGRPWLLRLALRTGVRSEAAMGAALRIATNDLRDGERGGAERAYRLATVATRFAPSW